MSLTVTFVPVVDGYAIFDGPDPESATKIGVVSTKHDVPLASGDEGFKEGDGGFKSAPLPRADWMIHFTAPYLKPDLLAAVVAGLPKS